MLMALGDDTDTYTVTPGSDSVLCPDGSVAGPGQLCPNTGVAFTGNAGLPLCSSMTLPTGFVGPVNCDPSSGPPTYTVSTGASQASAAAAAQAACSQAGGTFNASTGACAQSNATMYLVLGLGALITLLIATK